MSKPSAGSRSTEHVSGSQLPEAPASDLRESLASNQPEQQFIPIEDPTERNGGAFRAVYCPDHMASVEVTLDRTIESTDVPDTVSLSWINRPDWDAPQCVDSTDITTEIKD